LMPSAAPVIACNLFLICPSWRIGVSVTMRAYG
jgi:hypothetical protein